MQQPPGTEAPPFRAPSFSLIGHQSVRPGVLLLAIVAAAGALGVLVYAMGHSGRGPFSSGNDAAATSATAGADDDKDDDPNQIDTIVLGDPTDAPVPAHKGNHVSPVHPTILIVLPRSGDQVGMIPNSPAGQLLYNWLAAFNQANPVGLGDALPSAAPAAAMAAQMALRQRTGGFNLVSAKEVEPGVLVFRLRDQSPAGLEALGTLQMRPDSSPAAIESFSIRAVK